MKWENRLSKYEGSRIQVWIEDLSGEEQTKPTYYTLYMAAVTEDQAYMQIYFNAAQFLSIPLFDDSHTMLESGQAGHCFISHDRKASLRYQVQFEKHI